MSSAKDLEDFPDVHAKLQKPTKQSAFERQKAEAEAKRQREEAETAAVYKDFIKSFDRDDDDDAHNSRDAGWRSGFGANTQGPPSRPPPTGPSRRHFGTGLKSGPGSLGPPPPSFGKKRSFNDFSHGARDKAQVGSDNDHGSRSIQKAFGTSDDDEPGTAVDRAEEKAIARPTLRLSNLPPGTSPAAVKALLPDNLTVENVKFTQASSNSTGTERKSVAAIVTLSKETPANDIEAAVSSLQNRYLGYGHFLSLHRHLSSAVTSAVALPHFASSGADSQPFGAKPVETAESSNKNTQHTFHKGFAPPSSYNQAAGGINRAKLLHVPVKPPSNIQTIRLINMVIEGILGHGPEFEALLMSRSEVQREERWAWIWDARSEGGIWYRWSLWQIVTGGSKQSRGSFVPLFEGSHAWKKPEKGLPFEHSTELADFVSDSDYDSEDDYEEQADSKEKDETFLNPLEKAKLSHLLARLPTSLKEVRKGDIVRVTSFAVNHASRGVEEVVDMIISNIQKPLSLSMANPDHKQEAKGKAHCATTDENLPVDGSDPSGASLVALYVVSDILSAASSTTGKRHVWRYRPLIENALRTRSMFEWLGAMPDKMGWGLMRAETWRRNVKKVLRVWENWCAFSPENHKLFVHSFDNPPTVVKAENKAADPLVKSKWKVVEATQAEERDRAGGESGAPPAAAGHADGEPINDDDVDGEPLEDEDVEGEPIEEDDVEGEPIGDDDVEGEPIEEEDVEGEPIEEDDVEGEPLNEEDVKGEPIDEDDKAVPSKLDQTPSTEGAESQGIMGSRVSMDLKKDSGAKDSAANPGSARKPRMRAADMFASPEDSD
jgi:U2-associated protein SR140